MGTVNSTRILYSSLQSHTLKIVPVCVCVYVLNDNSSPLLCVQCISLQCPFAFTVTGFGIMVGCKFGAPLLHILAFD
jgi:hypothetical protein